MTLYRIPLTIICTLNGAKTDGVLVAVMADELAALEAERDRLAAEVATLRGVAREDLAKVRIILAAVAKDSADWARNMPDSDRKWNLVHQSQALGEAIATLDALTSPTDGGGIARALAGEEG